MVNCDKTGICQPSSSLWFFRLFVWMGCTHCLIVLPLGCPVSVGGLLQGFTSDPEELLPRFNVASFCLELLQDVHNTKHRDSVLLVSMYRLSILVILASNSAQRRLVPTKTSLMKPTSNFCNSETPPCPLRYATFLECQLLSYKMIPTKWAPVWVKQKELGVDCRHLNLEVSKLPPGTAPSGVIRQP